MSKPHHPESGNGEETAATRVVKEALFRISLQAGEEALLAVVEATNQGIAIPALGGLSVRQFYLQARARFEEQAVDALAERDPEMAARLRSELSQLRRSPPENPQQNPGDS